MKNKLINSIDLNLSNSELRSLISDVKLSLAFVIDSNHDGSSDSELKEGEVLAKSLDTAGTSDLQDSVYKPLNKNISHYPIAGEFVVVLKTSLGKFYLSTVNLFNSTSNNIDKDNVSGYVRFKDDENINESAIKEDKKGQKSVLENNDSPFDRLNSEYPLQRLSSFGGVGLIGRYGNSITFSKSNKDTPETSILNSDSKIILSSGGFTYPIITSIPQPPIVSSEINYVYPDEQIYAESNRIYLSARDRGMFMETSGIFSITSDNSVFITSPSIQLESTFITLGGNSTNNRVILGDTYLGDFKLLMDSMVRFAENLKAQKNILSLSVAAENFLTDINSIGWNNFNISSYTSFKVYVQ